MTEQDVIDLMKSSRTEDEWASNCDKVKNHFGSLPDFWFRAIILSGLFIEVREKFKK